MTKQRKIFILIVVAAAATGGYAIVRYERASAQRGLLPVSGNIEVDDVEMSFKISGRVQQRPVDEGMRVKTGQLVAKLDTEDLQAEAALRQAEVAAAAAKLAELEAGSRPQEIAAAAATAEAARVEMERLKLDYTRVTDLYQRKVATQQEYDTARAAYDSGVAKHNEAVERLKLVQEGPRKEQIEQARAQLEQARSTLQLAQVRLGYATLLSPLNGVVLSKNIEPGEFVAAGTPVVAVADIEHVYLRAYINETELGRVKLGQKVRVRTDTYPEKTYMGVIAFISQQAEFTPRNVQTAKERVKLVFRVKIDIDNPQMELKPGMPADGDIVLDSAR